MALAFLAGLEGLDLRVITDERLASEFVCGNCGEAYDDGPALITVRRADDDEVALCTDRCAEALGFVDAVLARKRAEARGDAICIVYVAD